MPFARSARPETLASLAHINPAPFWLDDPDRPEPAPPLIGSTSADLLVVGGGFTGLWTALLAKEADPTRDVVLLEAGQVADGASGRNGGFIAASLTHGFTNGLSRWPGELATLIALGRANLDAIEDTVARFDIDCDFRRVGELTAATEPYQVDELRALPEQTRPYGEELEWLNREQVGALIHSPLYLGAVYHRAVAMANPARLAWGLRRACLQAGVRLHEHTPAIALSGTSSAVEVRTAHGQVRAARVALATNAYPPLLKHVSHYIVPIYDYALITEPLSPAQRAAIGWIGRQGLGDSGNQFHYAQLTSDHRILWGGYDAIYHWRNGFGPHFETDAAAFGRLAEHFFQTFPQLGGLHFTHGWGGAIDTCSRFCAYWGTAHHGRTAYVAGYTGLGVGASRFGAQVMLDLLDGRTTERSLLSMVRSRPVPFPPEPFRSVVIHATRRSLDQADRQQGHRNLWLRTLDRLGLGFDS